MTSGERGVSDKDHCWFGCAAANCTEGYIAQLCKRLLCSFHNERRWMYIHVKNFPVWVFYSTHRSRWTSSLSSAVVHYRLMTTWSGTSTPCRCCEWTDSPYKDVGMSCTNGHRWADYLQGVVTNVNGQLEGKIIDAGVILRSTSQHAIQAKCTWLVHVNVSFILVLSLPTDIVCSAKGRLSEEVSRHELWRHWCADWFRFGRVPNESRSLSIGTCFHDYKLVWYHCL